MFNSYCFWWVVTRGPFFCRRWRTCWTRGRFDGSYTNTWSLRGLCTQGALQELHGRHRKSTRKSPADFTQLRWGNGLGPVAWLREALSWATGTQNWPKWFPQPYDQESRLQSLSPPHPVLSIMPLSRGTQMLIRGLDDDKRPCLLSFLWGKVRFLLLPNADVFFFFFLSVLFGILAVCTEVF